MVARNALASVAWVEAWLPALLSVAFTGLRNDQPMISSGSSSSSPMMVSLTSCDLSPGGKVRVRQSACVMSSTSVPFVIARWPAGIDVSPPGRCSIVTVSVLAALRFTRNLMGDVVPAAPSLTDSAMTLSTGGSAGGAVGVPVASADHGPSLWPDFVAATRTV